MLQRHDPREIGHPATCDIHGDAIIESGDDTQPSIEPLSSNLIASTHREPNVRVPRWCEAEARWKYSANHVRNALDPDGSTDDCWVSTESALPELMAHHHRRCAARNVVLGSELTT